MSVTAVYEALDTENERMEKMPDDLAPILVWNFLGVGTKTIFQIEKI